MFNKNVWKNVFTVLIQDANPRYILRNWVAQAAIEKAEQDDFSEVQFLLKLLQNPFRKPKSDYLKIIIFYDDQILMILMLFLHTQKSWKYYIEVSKKFF